MSGALRIALLRHDRPADDPVEDDLARALAAAGHHADVIAPRGSAIAELPLRLRKLGDRPARMPGSLLALARGGYDVAHAFTAQDGAVAALWSRLSGRTSVLTVREPLSRARVADRRLRLATLRMALEGVDVVLAPDEAVAESLRRWMAIEPRVVAAGSVDEHLAIYSSLPRR